MHDDIVKCELTAEGTNRLSLTDNTGHRTTERNLYSYAVKKAWANMVFGYLIDTAMKVRSAVNALKVAITHCGAPEVVVMHSPPRSQLQSWRFIKVLNKYKLIGSMGRVGVRGDNAEIERFFTLPQKYVLERHLWAIRAELRLAVVHWVERVNYGKQRQR